MQTTETLKLSCERCGSLMEVVFKEVWEGVCPSCGVGIRIEWKAPYEGETGKAGKKRSMR